MAFEISVFLENKIGHFEKVTKSLKQAEINIRSLNLSNIGHGWAMLNLLVDNPEMGYNVLCQSGNSVALREVIALEMKDEAGGLDALLIQLSRAGIHLESAYSRLITNNKTAILLIEVPDVLEATKLLQLNNIKIISDQLVYGK